VADDAQQAHLLACIGARPPVQRHQDLLAHCADQRLAQQVELSTSASSRRRTPVARRPATCVRERPILAGKRSMPGDYSQVTVRSTPVSTER